MFRWVRYGRFLYRALLAVALAEAADQLLRPELGL